MTTHGTFSTAEEKKLRGRTPGETIADIEQLCQERGFFYSLCLMVARFLWTSTDRAVDTDWSDIPNQGELSWLFGLLAENHIALRELPTDEVILEQVYKSVALLRELHMLMAFPMPFDNATPQGETLDQSLDRRKRYENWMDSGLGMVEPIFYGGEGAYDFQYLEMASKRYEPDEKWIREHKGHRPRHLRQDSRRTRTAHSEPIADHRQLSEPTLPVHPNLLRYVVLSR